MVPLFQGQRIDFTNATNIPYQADEEHPIADCDTELQWLKEDEQYYQQYKQDKKKLAENKEQQ